VIFENKTLDMIIAANDNNVREI